MDPKTAAEVEPPTEILKRNRVRAPLWWSGLIIIGSIVYLLAEFVFNAVLVEAAGAKVGSEEALRQAELFGRTLAGIGATLLLADLFFGGPRRKATTRVVGFTLTAVIAWPVVFFGQEWLVEHFLVAPSSADERQRAAASQAIKYGLSSGAIQVVDSQFDADAEPGPSEKTFLSLFGAIVYADGRMIDELGANREMLARRLAEAIVIRDRDRHWDRYTEIEARMVSAWNDYADQDYRYREEVLKIPTRVLEARAEMEEGVRRSFADYQKASSAFEARMEARAQEIAPRMYKWFERVGRCRSQNCIDSYVATYERELDKFGLPYVPPNYWLLEEDVSATKNIGRLVLHGVLTGGLDTALRVIDKATGGDGGWKDTDKLRTNSVEHYRKKLISLHAEEFAKSARGIPYGIEKMTDFRSHPRVAELTRKEVAKRGISLPGDWRIADHATFDAAAARYAQEQIDERWQQEARRRGYDIPPHLNERAFYRHSAVQSPIKADMGDYYVGMVVPDWTPVDLKTNVLDPNIRRLADEGLALARAAREEFEDGGDYADMGRSAVRATLIPPVSMGLSLFLVLMTMFKLPLQIHDTYQQVWGRGAVLKPRTKAAVLAVLSAIVITFPLLAANRFTADESPTARLLARIQDKASWQGATALRWVMNVEPAVMPVGEALESTLRIYAGFAYLSPTLDRMEHAGAEVWARAKGDR